MLAVAQTALNWNEEAPVAKKVRRDSVESMCSIPAHWRRWTPTRPQPYDQQKKELMNIKRDTQRMSEGQKKDLDKVLQKMTELQRQVADQNQVISVLTRNNQQINANINDPRITGQRNRRDRRKWRIWPCRVRFARPSPRSTRTFLSARGRETNGMIRTVSQTHHQHQEDR